MKRLTEPQSGGKGPTRTYEKPMFDVDTTFKPVGKSYTCTVTDVLTTYNKAGQIVKISYVCAHTFNGQTVIERDVCETTIARGLVHLEECTDFIHPIRIACAEEAASMPIPGFADDYKRDGYEQACQDIYNAILSH